MNKYLMHLLCLGLLSWAASAQANLLCPATGIPMSQDPGCTTPNYNNQSAQQQAAPQLPPQPTGYWVKTWGAIAPSPKGGVLGTAVGADSKAEAERLALADCKNKGGQSCKVQIAYHNQCGVMIIGDKFLGTARAETIDKASALGIKNCQVSDTNCRVYYSACTEPRFVKY